MFAQHRKSPGPSDFTDELNQTFKEELTPMLLKFSRVQRDETFPQLLL
jgi:hypothetical protein